MKILILLILLVSFICFGAFCPFARAGGPGTVSNRPVSEQQEPLQSDIGEIYISFVGERSLDEIIDDLQPQFQITPQAALQMAIPNTKNSLESALSAFSGSLEVGWTSSGSSPSVPTNAGSPLGQSQVQTLPPGLTNLFTLPTSMDVVSEYQAAASLYEQIKLINQSLKAVPHFKGYDTFIITVQVTLIPYQLNAAYDAYADLSFFCGTNEAPAQPGIESESIPMVFPIITSDELEAASDQRSLDKLTSLSLALSAAYEGVGAQAALSQLNQKLNAIEGNNLNSLLTVGKINVNTVTVRLGARNSTGSKAGLTMVPEVHNITFLVLAPKEDHEVAMISKVMLHHAGDGKVLSNLGAALGEKMKDEFASDIFGWYLGLKPDEVSGLLGTEKARENAWNLELAMMSDVTSSSNFSNTFTNFCGRLQNYFDNESNFDPAYLKRHPGILANAPLSSLRQFNVVIYDSLWMDVARIQGLGNPYENDLISLTHWEPVLPATNQLVLYFDDGQTTTTFTLNSGKKISSAASKMSAILEITNQMLHSDQIQIAGNDVKIVFPSLTSIAYSNLPTHLNLTLARDAESDITGIYSNFAQIKGPPTAPKPSWNIVRTYGFLTSGVTSNQFSIVIAASPGNTNAGGYLDIENPIVLSYWPTNGVIAAQVNGLFALQPSTNTMVTFTFGQLLTGQTIMFNLLDQNQKLISTLSQQMVYPPLSSVAQPSSQVGGRGKGSGQ